MIINIYNLRNYDWMSFKSEHQQVKRYRGRRIPWMR